MLNTKKLIYILPKVAYIAELLPAKKEHTFSIQSFRQINGDFLNENSFNPANIVKLFSKLEKEEYFLILPDFLFTNTIVNVEETNQAKIKEDVAAKLLPDLGISEETHELDIFQLTEFNGTSKVQLIALEKELLAPVRAAADEAGVTIEGVTSLSWTIKAVVSLEPSLSVMQMGDQLFGAEHYIGLDQTSQASVDEANTIIETIKTLKGAEPNIQTVYLFVNEVIEKKLADELSGTLPTQQLTNTADDDSKISSYVKQVIETGMKTLSIADYPVPKFQLGKATDEEKRLFITEQVEPLDTDEEDDFTPATEDDEVQESVATSETDQEKPDMDELPETEEEAEGELPKAEEDTALPLPTPSAAAPMPVSAAEVEEPTTDSPEESEEPVKKDDAETAEDAEGETDKNIPLPGAIDTETTAEKSAATTSEELIVEQDKPEKVMPPVNAAIDEPQVDEKPSAPEPKEELDVDLTQFAMGGEKKTPQPEKPADAPKKEVIKNASGIGNMLKMIFITLAVFVATVAIGIGVGFGLLSVANRNAAEPTPTPEATVQPEATPTPEPTASPEASPSAALNPADLSVLVVNATTKAGYAGTVQTKLKSAGYGTVNAGNAAGDYDPGLYVLMEEENADLLTLIKESSELDLEYLAETQPSTEDPRGTYDAVVVLAE
jgi:hypothetical protein